MSKSPSKHVVDEQEIQRFNWKREVNVGREFSQKEMRQELKVLGYAGHGAFLKAITSGVNPPIVKPKRGVYCFSPKPVFIERLQTVWDTYTTTANPRNYKSGKYEEVVSIETAIKVLKEAGYKVLKPTVQYEEI